MLEMWSIHNESNHCVHDIVIEDSDYLQLGHTEGKGLSLLITIKG